MNNEMKLTIDVTGINNLLERQNKKHDLIKNDEKYYGSKKTHKAYQNLFSQKKEHDLLLGLTKGFLKSAFEAFSHTFIRDMDKFVDEQAESMIDKWVKSNPNLSWDN